MLSCLLCLAFVLIGCRLVLPPSPPPHTHTLSLSVSLSLALCHPIFPFLSFSFLSFSPSRFSLSPYLVSLSPYLSLSFSLSLFASLRSLSSLLVSLSCPLLLLFRDPSTRQDCITIKSGSSNVRQLRRCSLDHSPRTLQRYNTLHATHAVIYVVPMLIVC